MISCIFLEKLTLRKLSMIFTLQLFDWKTEKGNNGIESKQVESFAVYIYTHISLQHMLAFIRASSIISMVVNVCIRIFFFFVHWWQ